MASSSLLRRTLCRSISSSSSSSTIRCYYSSSSSSSPPSILGRVMAQSGLLTKTKKLSYSSSSSLLSLRFIGTSLKKVAIPVDETLKKVLDTEIKCQEQEGVQDQVTEMPEGFPFEIVDTPGDQTIILKRDFAGENIQITVLMNDDDEMEEDGDGSEDNDNNDTSIQPTLSLVVNIDKGVGHTVEFCCNLNSDELSIESMATKKNGENDNEEAAYNGPEFADLDESLQKALHKYLKERGIEGSLFDLLHEYMMNKDEREYLMWLKNMKGFIES
ncbi:uncharacterized protein M6B38_379570 [Iris pallida]|uniref:Mitochondrial glycoprotein n=1 Tax=Iris pallida TaxID=29817 RepID=A0AAX6G7Q7_IRIPA|nr:uncharacterized protein M6B38_381905 [Iris pallida]KAJ6825314.1 uncharacterized protein M6B38_379570 [Iris pallida]